MSALVLTPGQATLADLERIWREGAPVELDPSAREPVRAAARKVLEAAAGGTAVYGVNTGFGKLASVRIAAEDTATLQRNLIGFSGRNAARPWPRALSMVASSDALSRERVPARGR